MDKRELLKNEARRIEEDATYSSKGHYEAARNWGSIHLKLGIPSAVIAGISGVTAFEELSLIAGGSAILVAALISISTYLNPSEKAQSHYAAAAKFGSLKNRVRIFREVELAEDSSESQKVALIQLSSERDTLNEESPQVPRKAFKKARKGIEEGESEYKVDKASNGN